ncbi:Hypothetical protein SMAX5B_019157 [Scophthalmus maximus]|uniref:Uncharacterized protein n=1 Tax=Scophthalmus maximus TaxID=52904 RepID=A0A2U9C7A4_SCOMX|nr:Hypothetical protein SMAX5B_019157 [Scophthalmus maximus]
MQQERENATIGGEKGGRNPETRKRGKTRNKTNPPRGAAKEREEQREKKMD